jgi:hypothetical protein
MNIESVRLKLDRKNTEQAFVDKTSSVKRTFLKILRKERFY